MLLETINAENQVQLPFKTCMSLKVNVFPNKCSIDDTP